MFNLRRQLEISNKMKIVQTSICDALIDITGDSFKSDKWKYEQGEGGGLSKIVSGEVIEKGGVNYVAIKGKLSPKIAKIMKQPENAKYFATGVSIVLHPKNPFIPTVHMNIRYFETEKKWWVGGGIDLTPYYLFIEDIKFFHQKLKDACDKYNIEYYPKYKKWCDEYFYLKHRSETRGVGGIFYDYLSNNWKDDTNFNIEIGNTFVKCYLPIMKKHINDKYDKSNREFQAYRRGRYVEFNLLYDRGTKFGIETNGRIESILMSLPPVANWKYNWKPKKGSKEEKIYKYLKPIDWINYIDQK